MTCSNYALNSMVYHSVKWDTGVTSDANTHVVCLHPGVSSTTCNVIPLNRRGAGDKKMQGCYLSRQSCERNCILFFFFGWPCL